MVTTQRQAIAACEHAGLAENTLAHGAVWFLSVSNYHGMLWMDHVSR